MSNLLISAKMTDRLFTEVDIAELYRTERIVPNTLVFFRRAIAMAQVANPTTLKFLGRVLKVATLALGYLQILRPPRTPKAHLAVAALKTSCLEAANIMLAYALNPQVAGTVEIHISELALQALNRLERYDPAFIHLVPVETLSGNKIHVEGDGVNLDDLRKGTTLIDDDEVELPNGILMRDDLLTDFEFLITNIAFPLEAIYG